MRVIVKQEELGRIFSADYNGGMYIDLGFSGRYPIEVLDVGGHATLRKKWDDMGKRERARRITERVMKWVTYMDDPEDDGHWAGWYQDYVDASRPDE